MNITPRQYFNNDNTGNYGDTNNNNNNNISNNNVDHCYDFNYNFGNFIIPFNYLFNEINLLDILWEFYDHQGIFVLTKTKKDINEKNKKNIVISVYPDGDIPLIYDGLFWEIGEFYNPAMDIYNYISNELDRSRIKPIKLLENTENILYVLSEDDYYHGSARYQYSTSVYIVTIIPGYIIDGKNMSYIAVTYVDRQ